MESLYEKYKDRAAFLFVYIREAHPDDGWKMKSNAEDDVVFNDPRTWMERGRVASMCRKKMSLTMPCVVDTMDDEVDNSYAGWPERIFIVDSEVKIAYAAEQGPWGFKPRDAERALKKILRGG